MTKEKRAYERAKILRNFDSNGAGKTGVLFGLPFTAEISELVIVPVPWNVTLSYLDRENTACGPQAILAASPQIDYFDPEYPDVWRAGIALAPVSEKFFTAKAPVLRKKARRLIRHLERGNLPPKEPETRSLWDEINKGSAFVNYWVEELALEYLGNGQIAGVLGGDHSAPLGLMRALARRYPEGFGVLHIDAHFDLRYCYEGFTYSHASIMRNASAIKEIQKFIHVGVRDFCEEEWNFVKKSGGHNVVYTGRELSRRKSLGASWPGFCGDVVSQLPQLVYVSFDIDALEPWLCPDTGTPVPGGLGLEEAFELVEMIGRSGRRIIGFDLCEVAPRSSNPNTWESDWNAIVGMRALWRLAIPTLACR